MRGAQLDLFAPTELDAHVSGELRALAERVPSHVRFGTSSWTFPGWAGLVYPGRPTERELVERGLELYARYPLFRTVGIDRTYYRPMDRAAFARYAEQLPDGFRCVSKVWNEITSASAPRTGGKNPHFLDVGVFEEQVLAPLLEGFAPHAGPLVFELTPAPEDVRDAPSALARRLGRFFAGLPRELDYAVELRNRELFTPRYLETLAEHRVGHVLNFWERMPDVGEQLEAPGVLTAPFVVCRLLIPPGRRYEERKRELAPFDAVRDEQPKMRDDVVRLALECEALGKVLFVIVNNKAEGSSPLTVRALAERVVAARDAG